jgi:hypothetical protein
VSEDGECFELAQRPSKPQSVLLWVPQVNYSFAVILVTQIKRLLWSTAFPHTQRICEDRLFACVGALLVYSVPFRLDDLDVLSLLDHPSQYRVHLRSDEHPDRANLPVDLIVAAKFGHPQPVIFGTGCSYSETSMNTQLAEIHSLYSNPKVGLCLTFVVPYKYWMEQEADDLQLI